MLGQISFKKTKNNLIEVGIHIADVSHFLRENSELEKEAYKRATSVYLVDRVVPMLPEALSNNLCSLRPNEEKLTFSAVFEIDIKGKIKGYINAFPLIFVAAKPKSILKMVANKILPKPGQGPSKNDRENGYYD